MKEINRIFQTWNKNPQELKIPESAQEFFDLWLDSNGYDCCDLFDIMKSWWAIRDHENVLMINYRQLKDDLPAQIARIARFIHIDPHSLNMDAILNHCSFAYMRERADKMVPFGGAHMNAAKSFFHKGPKRDYHTELTSSQIARFDQKAKKLFGSRLCPLARIWLLGGDSEIKSARPSRAFRIRVYFYFTRSSSRI